MHQFPSFLSLFAKDPANIIIYSISQPNYTSTKIVTKYHFFILLLTVKLKRESNRVEVSFLSLYYANAGAIIALFFFLMPDPPSLYSRPKSSMLILRY